MKCYQVTVNDDENAHTFNIIAKNAAEAKDEGIAIFKTKHINGAGFVYVSDLRQQSMIGTEIE